MNNNLRKVANWSLVLVPVLLGIGLQYACSYAAVYAIKGFVHLQALMEGTEASEFVISRLTFRYVAHILVFSQLVALLVFGIWFKRQTKNNKKVHIKEVIHTKTVGWLILFGIAFQLMTNFVLSIAYLFVPDMIDEMSKMTELAGMADLSLIAILATVIMAPIVEEIMFRGITFTLAKRAGANFVVANVIQAFLFAAYHMNFVQGSYAFVLGLFLGYTVKKYKTIYPAILTHLSFNLAANLLSAVSGYLPEEGWVTVILIVVCVVTTALGVVLFRADKAPVITEQEEQKEKADEMPALS